MSQPVSFIIEKMPEGGFVVTDAGYRADPARYCPPLYSSTTIDEALRFIRNKLEPHKGPHDIRGNPITMEQMDAGMKGVVLGKPSPAGVDWKV